MYKIVLIFFSIFLLSSCFEVKNLDFKGVDGIKLGKLEKKSLDLSLNVTVFNPNGFSIKVKSSDVDVFADDQLLGKAKVVDHVKIFRKKEDSYLVPIHIDLEDGVLLKLIKFALKDKVNIHLKGFIKGSVLGITKKITIDEMKEIEGKNFKFDSTK